MFPRAPASFIDNLKSRLAVPSMPSPIQFFSFSLRLEPKLSAQPFAFSKVVLLPSWPEALLLFEAVGLPCRSGTS